MPQDANASRGAPAPPSRRALALGLALGLGVLLVVIPALRLALPTTALPPPLRCRPSIKTQRLLHSGWPS